MSIYRYIQGVADNIINTFDNLNPIKIVESLNRVDFKIIPLTDSVNGFYNYISPNRQAIVINENLIGENFNITLFHELSHYFLGHTNTLLLNSSITSNIKEEYHADLLATCLYLEYVKRHRDYDEIQYPKRVCELMKYFT